MTHTLGSGPVQEEYLFKMQAVARFVDGMFNGDKKGKDRETGFILMVFPFEGINENKGHRCNYMSNAAREDVLKLLKEQVSYFEGKPDE